MLCGRLGTWIGTAVAAAVFVAADASALALLQSQSRACLVATCEFTPLVSGAGASTDILRTYTSTTPPNTYAFQAHGAMTVFGYDHWAAEAETSGSANLTFTIPGGAGPGVTASGDGYMLDSVLVTGATGTGTLRMVWHVTGSVGVSWSSSDPQGSPSANPVQLVFNCFTLNVGVCPTQRFSWTQNEPVDEIVNLDIPIVFGSSAQYNVSISVVAGTGVNTIFADTVVWQGASFGDFGSTGVLQDVVLLDAFGNPLDESGIQSESGFRYDLVGQVPEPFGLALAAPLVFAAARRRLAA